MKVKTSELTGAALDWAVAKCMGLKATIDRTMVWIRPKHHAYIHYSPSTDWAQGGPIIEREKIECEHDGFQWWARIRADEDFSGPTPLIAAMRCYVASKLGNEVDVPDDLVWAELIYEKGDEE